MPRARFVLGRRPHRPHFAGLPRGRDLESERVDQLVALGRRQVHVIAHGQQIRDAAELLHQRASRDLGGVRREDELHPQIHHRVVQPLRRDAAGNQSPERLVAGSDLWRRIWRAKIRPPATDPVMLLGDIGEIEELRERARDGKGFLDGHLLEQPRQRGEVGVAAASRFLRQRADALDPIERRLAFLSPKRFPQQLPKQAHVVSQGFGQLVAHVLSSLTDCGCGSVPGARCRVLSAVLGASCRVRRTERCAPSTWHTAPHRAPGTKHQAPTR